jgi:hypothetical protein
MLGVWVLTAAPERRPLVAQPLETDHEHEIVWGINQKGDQAFVMLAEM